MYYLKNIKVITIKLSMYKIDVLLSINY
jgi:hypothetical protein